MQSRAEREPNRFAAATGVFKIAITPACPAVGRDGPGVGNLDQSPADREDKDKL
jgi:hypothetical protein